MKHWIDRTDWNGSGAGKERTYTTDHGTYTLVLNHVQAVLWDMNTDREKWVNEYEYEIFAPNGRNFYVNHSFLESTVKGAEMHIGDAITLCSSDEDCCACEDCGCKECKTHWQTFALESEVEA